MATLQSVGIQVTETDSSPVTQAVSASIGAYVGHFNWGPVDEPILVTSEKQLGEIFGTPTYDTDKTASSYLTAESFLKYGDALQVIRAVPSTHYNAYGKNVATGTTVDNTTTVIKNAGNIPTTGAKAFYARCIGKLGDGLQVKVFHSTNATITVNADEISSIFTVVPNTTDWANAYYGSTADTVKDEIHIVVYDSTGVFTGTKGAVLETWQGLSLDPLARTNSGAPNHFKTVINTGSQYIFVGAVAEVAEKSGGVWSLATNSTAELRGVFNFFSGAGGLDGTLGTAADVATALALLHDVDNIKADLIFAEAFNDDTTALVNDALVTVATKRLDSMVFCSAPVDLHEVSTGTAKLAAVKAHRTATGGSNSVLSYVVNDSTPLYVYNKYSDSYVWIPACGHMAGLCAYTDKIADPWFSPAGFNRGQLRGVTKLAFSPNVAERDALYNSNINPIISVAGQGVVLYGDKTGQTRPSAFDRINVRRLFIALQRTISNAAKYQLFELNDEFTRNTFINTVEPYLRDVQGRRGIIDYRIVCDETNNTGQVIDTNRFVADIFIKPARSINYISLNFIATRTGVSFTEIGA